MREKRRAIIQVLWTVRDFLGYRGNMREAAGWEFAVTCRLLRTILGMDARHIATVFPGMTAVEVRQAWVEVGRKIVDDDKTRTDLDVLEVLCVVSLPEGVAVY
jgi:hypothetical protein